MLLSRVGVAVLSAVVFAGSKTAKADSLFSNIAFPGAAGTFAQGINDSGESVGYYLPPSNLGFPSPAHGFLDNGGTFTTINVPAAICGTECSTVLLGINISGEMVGFYDSATNNLTSFLDTAGNFTSIEVPGAQETIVEGINNAGQIVGNYTDANGITHGFLDTTGTFTIVDVPGALGTLPFGINNEGQIVGLYRNPNGTNHGFLDTAGAFATIDAPGGNTELVGINDSGQIVGCNQNCGTVGSMAPYSFLYAAGTFTAIDVPGAFAFAGNPPEGINDSGQIVGIYVDPTNDATYGYLATPTSAIVPEPRSLPLLAGCLLALAGAIRKKSAASRQE